jgi:HK97 family phage major capsid protein
MITDRLFNTVCRDTPDRPGAGDLLRTLETNQTEVKALFGSAESKLTKLDEQLGGHGARLTEIEQKIARRTGAGGPAAVRTWGQALVESEQFRSLIGTASQRGRAQIQLKHDRSDFETKTVSSLTTGNAGSLVVPEFITDPVMLPRRVPTVRSLLAPGTTTSNTIYFVQQTARQLNAATVAEGATKPESDLTFAQATAPVRTIAHWMRASRQMLDDAAQLQSAVDGELRYGLMLEEEAQLLAGDGTGQNLLGLLPQATAFSAPWTATGDTAADTLLQAIAQSEIAMLPATGVVMNVSDWRRLIGLKDGMGRYLSNGPFGPAQPRLLWDLPLVPSLAMPAGHFLVGNFTVAAQIFDRMEVEVLLSTEDQDNFVKNLVTIRAEERLALAVKQPLALVYGTLPT